MERRREYLFETGMVIRVGQWNWGFVGGNESQQGRIRGAEFVLFQKEIEVTKETEVKESEL